MSVNIDRKTVYQEALLSGLFALAVITPVGIACLAKAIEHAREQPLYESSERRGDRLRVTNSGEAVMVGLACETRYAFNAKMPTKTTTCFFPRGATMEAIAYDSLNLAEQETWRLVQERACDTAQNRRGYRAVCTGLGLRA